MSHLIPQASKTHLILSLIMLVLGLFLLVFMITVESEPGALPLALVVIGSIWHWISRKSRPKQIKF